MQQMIAYIHMYILLAEFDLSLCLAAEPPAHLAQRGQHVAGHVVGGLRGHVVDGGLPLGHDAGVPLRVHALGHVLQVAYHPRPLHSATSTARCSSSSSSGGVRGGLHGTGGGAWCLCRGRTTTAIIAIAISRISVSEVVVLGQRLEDPQHGEAGALEQMQHARTLSNNTSDR